MSFFFDGYGDPDTLCALRPQCLRAGRVVDRPALRVLRRAVPALPGQGVCARPAAAEMPDDARAHLDVARAIFGGHRGVVGPLHRRTGMHRALPVHTRTRVGNVSGAGLPRRTAHPCVRGAPFAPVAQRVEALFPL